MKKLPMLIYILFANSLISQSFSVFNINPSTFPVIKSEFFLLDDNGKQITNLNINDFDITENGIPRKVLSVNCPPTADPVTVSIAMSIDVSGSMASGQTEEAPVELGKLTAGELCKKITMPPSEFALQICGDKAILLNDFTTDKNLILNKIPPIIANSNNNFEEQLLNKYSGLLNIAKRGKNRRTAIIYTDAFWKALTDEFVQGCIDTCKKYNIEFYAVIYSGTNAEPNGIKKSLREICEATGGYFFDGVIEKNAAEDLSIRIQTSAQGVKPCSIEWESETVCSTDPIKVKFICKPFNLSYQTNYPPISIGISELAVNPKNIYFKNIPPGQKADTTIIIKAYNRNFKNIRIIRDNPQFTVYPSDFDLNNGDSITLTISYSPADSNYNLAEFDITSDDCNNRFYVSGSFPFRKINKPTLRVTHPNGGEKFGVGSDTLITWEGILPSDTVSIYYSINNGVTWNLITDTALGLKYSWKNLPNTPSSNCLIKIKTRGDNDSSNTTPKIEWKNCYGGVISDWASDIIQTKDGGYIFTGITSSIDVENDSSGYNRKSKSLGDVWVVKLSAKGNVEWQKFYGGYNIDYGVSICQANDDGFYLGCYTASDDGEITNFHGYIDYWILKITSTGSIESQKCLGGTKTDYLYSIAKTKDGGLVAGGTSMSNDGDAIDSHGTYDFWIVKLSSAGDVLWTKTYGSSLADQCNSIKATEDGGFIAAGDSFGNDFDVSHNFGLSDIWIIKCSETGTLEWENNYGGSDEEVCNGINGNLNDGFIAVGSTKSNDGMVQGNDGSVHENPWIIKINKKGSLVWQNFIEKKSICNLVNVELSNNGYFISGNMLNENIDSSSLITNPNIYLGELDFNGNLLWRKTIGGSLEDGVKSLKATNDGGFIIAGYTYSKNGDVTDNHGYINAWIVKFAPLIFSQTDVSDSVFSIIAPEAKARDIDMKECLVGNVKDSVIQDYIVNTGIFPCRIDSIYFSGADAGAFDIVSGVPPYSVTPGAKQNIEVTFTPVRAGLHQAVINIITQSDTLRQNIIGTGIERQIEVLTKVIDFGLIKLGAQKDSTLFIIKNISSAPVTVTDTKMLGPDMTQFTILSGGGSFTLAPSEEREISLRFAPVSLGRTNGQIGFEFSGFGSPAVAQLYGQGTDGYIYVQDDSAYAGQRRVLHLKVAGMDMADIKSSVSGYQCNIRFENTILKPFDKNLISAFDQDTTTILIKGTLPDTSDVLSDIIMITGLGKVTNTDLEIIDFTWLDSEDNPINLGTGTQSGNFKLLGICTEGGSRLINPNDAIKLTAQPNPSNGIITINLYLTEKGQTSLILTDISGKNIKTVFDLDNDNFNLQTINIPTNDLVSGEYFLILTTPSLIKTEQISLIK